MIRTARAPTASGFSKVAKSSGSFFSSPLAFGDRFGDDGCPVPLSASHVAPKSDRPPTAPPPDLTVGPTPPEPATRPRPRPPLLVPPKASKTPTLLPRSSKLDADLPKLCALPCGIGAVPGNRLGVAARWLVPLRARGLFAPKMPSVLLAAALT